MKRILLGLSLVAAVLLLTAAAIMVSDLPQTTTANDTDLILLSIPSQSTNKYILFSDFQRQLILTQAVNISIVTNHTVINTQQVNQSIVTNLTVINDTHVGKLTVQSNAFITNTYFLTIRAEDITWPNGPTGAISFAQGSLQNYATWTPISITSVTGATNGYGNTILLCLTNKATTNITFTPPSGWQFGDGDTATCTNGKILEIWLFEATGRKTIATKSFH